MIILAQDLSIIKKTGRMLIYENGIKKNNKGDITTVKDLIAVLLKALSDYKNGFDNFYNLLLKK